LVTTTLSAMGGKRRSHRIRVGAAKFSIAAGKTATVRVGLDTQGRHLLDAGRGELAAGLEILKSEPTPEETQTANVRLTQQTYRGEAKQ
jgi:hypothetical protein